MERAVQRGDAEIRDVVRSDILALTRAEASPSAKTEQEAMNVDLTQECAEAQQMCARIRLEACHQCQEHGHNVSLNGYEAEDRVRVFESGAVRRRDGVISAHIQQADAVHSATVVALHAEVAKSQAHSQVAKVGDLENRRMAMGSRLLELNLGEAALEAKCQSLQPHHEEVGERGNHENTIRGWTVEETSARLRQATRTLNVEASGLHRSYPKRNDALSEDIATLRSELETATQWGQSGEIEVPRIPARRREMELRPPSRWPRLAIARLTVRVPWLGRCAKTFETRLAIRPARGRAVPLDRQNATYDNKMSSSA